MSRRFAIVLGSVLVLLAATIWLVSREATLVWAVNQAAQRYGGKLSASGVTGSLLYGPVGFGKIQYRTAGMEVDAERGSIELERWPLLSRNLVLRRIEVDSITLVRDPTAHSEPAKLPERLTLPLHVTINALHVERIALSPQGIAVGPLLASAQVERDTWSAQLRSLQTTLGVATGEARIATVSPFALGGSLSLTQRELAYQGRSQISGTLERIQLQASASAKEATARADTLITPFASSPIEHIAVDARNVDPHYFHPALPNGLFALQLALDRDPNEERVHGGLQLNNGTPGAWDEHRVPLAQLKGHLEGTLGDLTLKDLLLDGGAAGRLSGQGHLRRSKLDLKLVARQFDLHRLHGRLYRTQLAGSIRAKASHDEQHFSMQLTEKEGRIDVDGRAGKGELTIESLRATANGGRLVMQGKLGLEGDKPFLLTGTLENFDPSRFGKFNKARVNSRFDARGALAPVLQLKADLDVFGSLVGGMATAGKIRWHSKGTKTPDVALDLALDVGDTHARASGTAFDPVHMGKLDIQLSLEGSDLSHLFPIVGIPLPPTPAYKLVGHLLHHDEVWTFEQFSGKVGESDLAGDFTVDRRRAVQMVRADLVSDTLRLADLGGFIGVSSGPKQTEKDAKGQLVLPNEPFNLEKIRAADADVHFVGRRILTQALPFDNITAHLRIVRGVLTIEPLDFGMVGGSIVGKVTLDATQPVIAGAANMQVKELRLERLVPKVQNSKASVGTMQGRAKLNGTGNSVAAMLGTSSGYVTVLMDGGEISDLVLRLMDLDIEHTLIALLRGDKHIPVRCMIGHFVADHGHLKPQPFILDTEHTKVAMDGDIDLGAEQFNLRLVAQPKDMSLASLRGPIVIEGPFDSPSAHPDLKRAIARGVAAITLGIVATPAAALMPLFELGTARDANCKAIVTQARAMIDQQPGAQPPTPDATEAGIASRKGGG